MLVSRTGEPLCCSVKRRSNLRSVGCCCVSCMFMISLLLSSVGVRKWRLTVAIVNRTLCLDVSCDRLTLSECSYLACVCLRKRRHWVRQMILLVLALL